MRSIGLIEREWMTYTSGESLMRLPSKVESALTLEDLAKHGKVYFAGRSAHYEKSTLAKYRQCETSENIITHIQEYRGKTNYFLKSYGLDSWMITLNAQSHDPNAQGAI